MAPCFLIFRRRFQQQNPEDDAGTNAVSLARAGKSACGLEQKDKVGESDYMTLFLVFFVFAEMSTKRFSSKILLV